MRHEVAINCDPQFIQWNRRVSWESDVHLHQSGRTDILNHHVPFAIFMSKQHDGIIWNPTRWTSVTCFWAAPVSQCLQPVQAAPYMLHLGVGPSLATLSLSIDIIGVVRCLACGFAGFGSVVAAEKWIKLYQTKLQVQHIPKWHDPLWSSVIRVAHLKNCEETKLKLCQDGRITRTPIVSIKHKHPPNPLLSCQLERIGGWVWDGLHMICFPWLKMWTLGFRKD